MKTLYVFRHAKSSHKYSGIKDIDRPLSKRGINNTYLISKALKSQIKCPDLVVTSCANRALHTSVIFSQVFDYPMSNLKISKELYSFSDGYLIKTIKALENSFQKVAVFSHDHGVSTFVNKFGNRQIKHVPTCGVIGIQFDCKNWKDIKPGKTFLFEHPKLYK
jgi:phosphohistidine phosphatase